ALMMRLAAKTELFFGLIVADRTPDEQDRGCRQAVRLSSVAARLIECYRNGLVSFARLQGWAEGAAGRLPAPDAFAASFPLQPVLYNDPAARDFAASDPDNPDGGGPRGGSKSVARLLAELAAFDKAACAALADGFRNGTKLNGNGTHLQTPTQFTEASAK